MDVISLFSGAGGMDVGFRSAGYDIVYASDYNEDVEKTYNENHPNDIHIEDIQDIDPSDLPECDGIIGGPPCQTWSLAGNHKGSEDKKGAVVYDYLNIIRDKNPQFFVMENVAGILSSKHEDEFNNLLDEFDEAGYDVYYKKLNASYYGVPQERKRVFVVGLRSDLDKSFEFPEQSEDKLNQNNIIKFIDQFGEPIPVDDGSSEDDELAYPNHEYYVDSFSSRFMSRQRVRNYDEPAYTVMASARHQRIHPKAPKMIKEDSSSFKFKEGFEDDYRRYSVREVAWLQTFPNDFIFYYDNIKEGYRMVGNAVPPKLAEVIANQL